MIESEKIQKIRSLIQKQNPVVILTHANPDGDAIGSSLALGLCLKKLKIPVKVIIPDSVPAFLEWLPGTDLITIARSNRHIASQYISEAKIIFCLDFNAPDRINDMEELLTRSDALKILIDHHEDSADFADIVISESWRGSVGEMIYLFINEVFDGSLIDGDIATALYVAIMTDTGNFSYGSSYTEIFSIVGELMRFNIDKDKIYRLVYDNYTEDRMRLMGYCMQNKMVVLKKYHTAYLYITSAELRKFKYKKGDTEGFVNIPFSINGIRFTALFIEKRKVIKISFRSRGNFPVNRVAEKHFNGGGHINAAGGELNESMKSAIEKFEKILPEYEKELCEQ